MTKPSFATVWLDGCSGCHMSFLDIDERLITLAQLVDIVYSPLVDIKVFPAHVDIALVEGAVSSEEDLEKIKHIRAHTTTLISLGDCAVTSNVPSMRNPWGPDAVLRRAYIENVGYRPLIPDQVIPRLLPKVIPIHHVVTVDVFIPGCPPSADNIFFALTELLAGRIPDLRTMTRFGA